MAAVIGISDPPATIDALLLSASKTNPKAPVKASCVRTYATLDNPTPAYWSTLMVGRAWLDTSLKFKLMGKMVLLSDVIAGKYDALIIAYVKFLMLLGKEEGCFDHEMDAATAAQGGTVAQLNAAVLHANKVAREVPGWNGQIYVCITGYQVGTREPLYLPALQDADKIAIDPYPTGNNTVDSVAKPIVKFLSGAFPGKPLMITEWGVPSTNPQQAMEVSNFCTALATDPVYASVQVAEYWNSGGFALNPAAMQALASGISASVMSAAPDQQLAAAQAALIAEVAKNAALTGTNNTLNQQLAALNLTLAGNKTNAEAAITALQKITG